MFYEQFRFEAYQRSYVRILNVLASSQPFKQQKHVI